MITAEYNDLMAKFGLATIAAFFGAVARSRFWFYPDDLKTAIGQPDPRAGKFNHRRCITELSTSVALGMISAGVCEYMHCPIVVLGGLSAALGLVGGAAAGELAENFAKAIAKRVLGGIE